MASEARRDDSDERTNGSGARLRRKARAARTREPKPVVISVGGAGGAGREGAAVAEIPAALPGPGAPPGSGPDGNGMVTGSHPVSAAGPRVTVSSGSLAGRPIGGRRPKDLVEPGRVRLRLAHVGPWSVFKLSILFGTLAMAAVVAGLAVLYLLLTASGVIASIEHLVNSTGVVHHFRLDAGWIFVRVGWAAVGLVVIGALIATLLSVTYNSLADLSGGLDVTLVEHPHTVIRKAAVPTWTTRFAGTRLATEDRVSGNGRVGDGREGHPGDGLKEASGL